MPMASDFDLDKKILAFALKDKKFTMELVNSINYKYFHPNFQWLYKILEAHFIDPKFREIPTQNIIKDIVQSQYSILLLFLFQLDQNYHNNSKLQSKNYRLKTEQTSAFLIHVCLFSFLYLMINQPLLVKSLMDQGLTSLVFQQFNSYHYMIQVYHFQL